MLFSTLSLYSASEPLFVGDKLYYSKLNGSKYYNIQVILSEVQEFPSTNLSKSTSSSSEFTSRFLLW